MTWECSSCGFSNNLDSNNRCVCGAEFHEIITADETVIKNVAAGADINTHACGLIGAGFWVRGLARIIDITFHNVIIIIAAIILIISTAFMPILGITSNKAIEIISKPEWYNYLFIGTGMFLYQSIMVGSYGASLGKRFLGLVVLKTNGKQCTLPAALGRSLAFYIDSLFFGIVAYSEMKPPYQQRFGDKWFDTYVVKKSSVSKEILQSNSKFILMLLIATFVDIAIFYISLMLQIHST